jgi:rhodanese-related sulfurtransferase
VSPEQLAAAISGGNAPAILDVRSRAEYAHGHVPGAIHLPFWLSPFRAGALPVRRSEPLVVYCGHGPRAWLAGAVLRARGFERVTYLEGHMAAWARAGLPLVRQ